MTRSKPGKVPSTGRARSVPVTPTAEASDRLTRVAIQLAVASTVVLLPGGFDRWVLPKVLVLLVAASIGAFGPARGRLPRWVEWGLVGCGAALAGLALIGAAPLAQLFGRWPRYEGLVVLPAYAAAVWLGARILGPHRRGVSSRVLFRATAWASLALTSVAALEAAGFRPIPSDATRPGSLTGSGTDQGILAAILMVVLAVPSIRLIRTRTRLSRALLIYAGCGAGAVGVALSASRIALGALLVGIVLVSLLESVRANRTSASRFLVLRTAGIAALAWGAIVLVALTIPLTRSRILSVFSSASVWSDRPLIWRETMRIVARHPLLGVGPSGFVDAIPAQHDAAWYHQVGAGVTLDSPHSGYLQVLLAGGYPLLLGVGALCVAAVIALLRRWRNANLVGGAAGSVDSELIAAASGAIAVLAVGLVTSFTTPSIVLLPALLAGAALSRPPGHERRTTHRIAQVGGASLLATSLVLTSAGVLAELPLNAAVGAAQRGDVAAAQRDFTAAQRLRPWDSDIAQLAAQSMAQAADAGSTVAAPLAIAWATESLKHTPDSILSGQALATTLMSQGDLATARAELEDLQARAPFNPQVAHRLGGVLAMQGDLNGARQQLEIAADMAPNDADILSTLAYVYTQLGNNDAANAIQQRIAALTSK